MNKILMILMVAAFVSCSDSDALKTIERIKGIGNDDLEQAMLMLDSILGNMTHESEYVQMKFALLDIRLKDKADIVATSDSVAKVLTHYFDKYGKGNDMQEAHFYAGSVYRDLQDTPNSLSHFLKSEEVATNSRDHDEMMLRNTYSNLMYLFYNVQDYQNAHIYARKEYQQSKKIGKTALTCLTHLGMTLEVLDSLEQAHRVFVETLDTMVANPKLREDTEILCSLLFHFAYLNDSVNASKCLSMVEQQKVPDEYDGKLAAYAEYYELMGKTDDAIRAYQRILENGTDLFRMYDAAKALFHIYHENCNLTKADHYADLYIQISDSIDLGKRQELAATVNNQYKYQRDVEEERQIMEAGQQSRNMMWTAILLAICAVLGGTVYFQRRRNKHLEEVLSLSNELTDTKAERDKMKDKLQDINAEIGGYRDEIKYKEQLLDEKLEENKRFIALLHKSELEERAEDVIEAIHQASYGRLRMSKSDWQRFYHSVDELQPDLMVRLVQHLGKFTEQQQQVCYLLSIGLTNAQIENLTGIPHVTVWRWVKKMEWVHGDK